MTRPKPHADLRCPVCRSVDTYVRRSRGTTDATAILRKRTCAHCGGTRQSTELPNDPLTEAEAEEIRRFAERALAAYAKRTAA